MIEKPEELRGRLLALAAGAWAASAIGFLFESGLVEHLCEPRSVEELAKRLPAHGPSRIAAVLEVAEHEGFVVRDGDHYKAAPGVVPFAVGVPRMAVQGDLRTNLMQTVTFLDTARSKEPSAGWQHTSTDLLQAQGDASGAFVGMLKAVMPLLGDASERVEREGAAFLDVGTGVGAISIAVCRAFPRIRAVGLDLHEPALELARENVTRAGFDERIEMRRQPVQDLRDESTYDIAWVPLFFLPASCVAEALARVHASLRPGGWMVVGAGCRNPEMDRRLEKTWALVNDIWGGTMRQPGELQELLESCGLRDVQRSPGPPSPMSIWCGRRE